MTGEQQNRPHFLRETAFFRWQARHWDTAMNTPHSELCAGYLIVKDCIACLIQQLPDNKGLTIGHSKKQTKSVSLLMICSDCRFKKLKLKRQRPVWKLTSNPPLFKGYWIGIGRFIWEQAHADEQFDDAYKLAHSDATAGRLQSISMGWLLHLEKDSCWLKLFDQHY